MDSDRHTPAAIFGRFRSTLLTDDQPFADQLFAKASEVVPTVREAFDGELMDYEIFLLAGLLVNMREIRALKKKIHLFRDRISSSAD